MIKLEIICLKWMRVRNEKVRNDSEPQSHTVSLAISICTIICSLIEAWGKSKQRKLTIIITIESGSDYIVNYTITINKYYQINWCWRKILYTKNFLIFGI